MELENRVNRREVLAMGGQLAIGLAVADFLGGCAQGSPPVEGAGPRVGGSELSRPRPILHVDFEGTGDQQHPVVAAVDIDGHRLDTYGAWEASWAPDGSGFAFAAQGGTSSRIYTANPDSRQIKTLFTPGKAERLVWKVAWSPDSRRIAAIVNNAGDPSVITGADIHYTLVIVDATSGRELARHALPDGTLLDVPLSPPNKFRWSPDARRVLISWENAIAVHATGGAIERISASNVVADWSPDSKGVYYLEIAHCCDPGSRALGGFYFKPLAQSRVELTSPQRVTQLGYAMGPFARGISELSPSGSRLLFYDAVQGGAKGQLAVYELGGSAQLDLASPSRIYNTPELIADVQWSPDEKLLAALTAAADNMTTLHLRTLTLETEAWKDLATVNLGSASTMDVIDFLGFHKNLSWTE